MNKELSIIVPMYNAERTIEKCLQSILGQTYSNFELLLVMMAQRIKPYRFVRHMQRKTKESESFHRKTKD